MIVDTHVHVWDLKRAEYDWLRNDTSILNNTWHVGQLEAERKDAGITAGVLVQAAGNLEDTEVMLETARKTSWIKGVVCWLPLMNTKATQQLLEDKYLKEPFFSGIRHQVHDEKDPGWLLQPAVIENLKMLAVLDIPYDMVAVLPAHIETALKVAEKVPGLRIVFDHLSQPPVSTKERFGKWGELMKTASQHPQFYSKISGLGTASGNFANRKKEDIKPYIEFVLTHFGVDRCFCGGDWPVSLLASGYKEIWHWYIGILKELLPAEHQRKVLNSNACNFYNLML